MIYYLFLEQGEFFFDGDFISGFFGGIFFAGREKKLKISPGGENSFEPFGTP